MKKALAILAGALGVAVTAMAIDLTDIPNMSGPAEVKEILRLDWATNLEARVDGAGLVAESNLVAATTDGVNAKRSARVALTTTELAIGSNALTSITFPDNAIIDNAYLDTTTVMSSTNAGSTLSIGTEGSPQSIKLTITGDVSAGISALVPVGTAATAVKLGAQTSPYITVTVGDYTGGAGVVVFDYWVSD